MIFEFNVFPQDKKSESLSSSLLCQRVLMRLSIFFQPQPFMLIIIKKTPISTSSVQEAVSLVGD